MSKNSEPIPGDEVRMQLNRMLASRRFRIATRQSQILRYVVEQTLAGATFNENIIGMAIYGRQYVDDENHAVRVHASRLRTNIPEYYAKEGANDPVVIKLPEPSPDHDEGESYTPRFTYKVLPEIEDDYRQGVHYLASNKPELLALAASSFDAVVKARKTHIGAWVGLIESRCRLSFFFGHTMVPENVIFHTFNLCTEFLDLYPNDARAHLGMAATLVTLSEFAGAAIYFQKALTADRALTEQSLWYAALLVRVSKRQEALAVIHTVAMTHKFNALLQAACAVLYYLAQEDAQLHKTLVYARNLDVNCWLVRLLQCVISIDYGKFDIALHHYDRISLMDVSAERRAIFVGLGQLCALRSAETGELTEEETIYRKFKIDEEYKFSNKRADHIQSLVLQIAHRNIDEAANHFVAALAEREPVACWIPLIPIFSVLKPNAQYQEYVELLERHMEMARRHLEP